MTLVVSIVDTSSADINFLFLMVMEILCKMKCSQNCQQIATHNYPGLSPVVCADHASHLMVNDLIYWSTGARRCILMDFILDKLGPPPRLHYGFYVDIYECGSLREAMSSFADDVDAYQDKLCELSGSPLWESAQRALMVDPHITMQDIWTYINCIEGNHQNASVDMILQVHARQIQELKALLNPNQQGG